MNKTKLTHKLWAKVAAYFLFVVMTTALLTSALGLAFAYEEGWFREKVPSFADSPLCREVVFDYLQNYGWEITAQNVQAAKELQEHGVTVKVTDQREKVIFDNTDDKSQIVDYTYGFNDYTIQPYVNAPFEDGTEIYYVNNIWNTAYQMKDVLWLISGLSVIFVIVLFSFQMCAAGHRGEGDEIVLKGLNKVPFDLLAVISVCICAIPPMFIMTYGSNLLWNAVMAAISVVFWSAFGLGLCATFAARVKGGKWWRNTVICMALRLVFKLLKKVRSWFAGVFGLLPAVWKSAVAYIGFMLVNFFCALLVFEAGSGFALILLFLFDVAVFAGIILLANQLKNLKKAGKALADGDLTYKLDTSKMKFDVKEHGDDLNSISLGMGKAVEERMKSERFKTELITNVSHDLKTPLTSIVTYVDLLKKEDLGTGVAKDYVETLDRQSAKLKKLTEDLVEASKAASGVITVSRENLNLSELLGQSVAEFSERFASAQVEPVVTCPEEAIVSADGRLLWRVFDNLMQNICKYSMPGTRAYFDVKFDGFAAEITIKNISARPLNITADELIERFVRGDSSRSTEGSGLGLSIAKSLVEVQGGYFKLELDGDLFKVIIKI